MKHVYTSKKIISLICFVITLQAVIKAQPAKMPVRVSEIMLNSFLSGNDFGTQRNPSIGISIGKRLVFSGGPVFNRDFHRNTGGLISARYFVVNDGESYSGRLRLSSIISMQRMCRQSLSKEAILREQMTASVMKNDESACFKELQYCGWEASAGFGCSYRFEFGMILQAEATVCYYTSQQQTHAEIHSFRAASSSSLRIGFGIGWSLSRRAIPRVSEDDSVLKVQISE